MKYLGKDQNIQDETTVYWFDIDGETYGVAECGGQSQVLDCDGAPLVDNYTDELGLFVTDEMRNDY